MATLEIHLVKHIEKHNRSPLKAVKRNINFIRKGQDIMRKSQVKAGKKKKNTRISFLDGTRDWKYLFDYDEKQYIIPVHICISDERPDIFIWSDAMKKIIMIELTCPAEENILQARDRKTLKYKKLISQIKDQKEGWSVIFRAIEAGSRGFISFSVSRCLRDLGMIHTKQVTQDMSEAVARCSYRIQRSSSRKDWDVQPLVVIKSAEKSVE